MSPWALGSCDWKFLLFSDILMTKQFIKQDQSVLSAPNKDSVNVSKM